MFLKKHEMRSLEQKTGSMESVVTWWGSCACARVAAGLAMQQTATAL